MTRPPHPPIPDDAAFPLEFRLAVDAQPVGPVIEPLARLLIGRWKKRKAAEVAEAAGSGDGGPEG